TATAQADVDRARRRYAVRPVGPLHQRSDTASGDGSSRSSVRRATRPASDPDAAVRSQHQQPRIGSGVPEAREVEIAASAQRAAQCTAPAMRGGTYQERAGEEALETAVAALEPQVGAARGENAGRTFPPQGGRNGRGA